MDIESNNLLLVEVKHLIRTEDMDIWNYKNELTTLIDEAIARQSVKSEDVQEAIVYLQPMTEHSIMSGNFAKHLKTAIAALQAYQPTARKNRIVEEVAISKTETTSCEWCDGEAHYLSQSDYTLLGIQGNTLYASGDDCTDIQINYCPMCGRKLK